MKMEEFRAKLGRLKAGQEPFTLVLDDPAGNSYLQVNSETIICYRDFVVSPFNGSQQDFKNFSNNVKAIRKSEFRFFGTFG